MPIIRYDTKDAVFTFPYRVVIEGLKQTIKSNDVEDDKKCLAEIMSRTASGTRDITITIELEGDYISRIIYIVSDLIKQGNGSVYCKRCQQPYSSSEVIIQRITSFSSKPADKKVIENIKRTMGFKGPVRLPGMGGTIITCNKDHELLRTIEWIT